MVTVDDLFAALKKADEAGNAEDASQIAEILNGMGFGQRPAPKAPEPEPKLKDYIKDIPKALGRGVVGLGENAAVGASALLPDEYEKKAREGIESLAQPALKYLAPSSQKVGESVSSQLASGLGSIAPFFAIPLLGPAARVANLGLAGAAQAGVGRLDAEKSNATPEQRSIATALNVPVGLIDVIAPEIAPFKNILLNAFARGGVEGLTSSAQQLAQNLIAKNVYNPNQEISSDVGEQGAYGAGVGALASLIIDMTLGRRAHAGATQPVAPELETPAQAPETQQQPPQLGYTPGEPELTPIYPIPREPRREYVGPYGLLPEEAGAPRLPAPDQQATTQQALPAPEAPAPAAEPVTPSPEAMQSAAGMPGFTGAPDVNDAMIAQAKARREAAEKQRKVDLQSKIKEVHKTTFSADPVQNELAKRRALEALGVKEPEKYKPLTQEQWESLTDQQRQERIEAAAANDQTRQFKAAPKYAPRSEEEQADLEQHQKDIAAARDQLKGVNQDLKKTQADSTSLWNTLTGAIHPEDFKELEPPSTKPGMFNKLKGKPMSKRLSDMVADGELNEYLPPDMRITEPGQDESAGVQHIIDMLHSGNTGTFDQQQEIEALNKDKERLQDFIKSAPPVEHANAEAQQFAQREQGQSEAVNVSTDDMIKHAQGMGINTDDIHQNVAMRFQEATPEQFNNAFRQEVESAIRSRNNGESQVLAQAAKGEKTVPGTKEGARIEKELTGKTATQAVQWLINNAPTRFHKFVSQKILNTMQALQKRGVKFEFTVASGGERNAYLFNAQGLVDFRWSPEGTTARIMFNGEPVMANQHGFPSGMNYGTVLHEMLHSVTRTATKFLGANHPIKVELHELYNKVVAEFNKQAKAGTLPEVLQKFYKRMNNALSDPDELISWGISDEGMQKWLNEIKVGEKQSVMSKIVSLVREVLGIPKHFETALDRLVKTTESILDIDQEVISKNLQKQGYSFGKQPQKERAKPQQMSMFSKAVRDMLAEDGETETKKMQFGKSTEKANVNQSDAAKGKAGIDLLDSIGRGEKAPEPSAFAKMKSNIEGMSKEEKVGFFKEQARKFDNFIGNKFFSSDYALQSELKSQLERAGYKAKEILGMMLHLSTSQAVNANGVANAALNDGGVKYNEELHKWQTFKSDDNMVAVIKKIHQLGEKYGISGEDAQRIFHVATEAARTQELNARNADLDRQIKAAKTQAEAAALERKKKNTGNMDAHEIAVGMKMFEIYPELKEAVKTWNGTRKHVLDAMVEGGLYTLKESELLLDSAAYVPFYREDQIEAGKGPKEVVNSLRVAADKRMKGSEKPVNDILDNMVRWTQYAISRSVRAKSARTLAEAAVEHNLGNEVFDAKNDPNVIKIWDKGRERFFKLEDPLWVEAFTGLESVALPMVGFASKVSGILRDSIVMYPVFSVAQVPQDSFAAMFSSGLKPQYALRIPMLAIKEFIQTLRGKSTTHEKLKSFGVSGLFDSTAESIRKNFEDSYGLSSNPSLKNRVRKILGDIATASDNSVRQAVYEASMAQGLSEAEAIEKSFEIFNPHRRGTSKELAIASKLIPFFNAYIAVQHVAYKTLTGKGVSPSQREEALKTLAATSTSVFLMSFLYAALNADDDDYLRKPTPTRDRLLMIPGTGGASIPIRADMFSLPKILGEHVYLLMTDNGYEDPAKFRASMSSALIEAVTSPTVLPQVIKPIVETSINYDFFQKKPIVGIYQQKEETERQFDSTTSEFAKLLGKTGAISPLAADHLIRGFFGSTGGLMLYMTNPMIAAATGQPRPDISMSDAVATLPGMSGFMEKSYESALRHDFYQLREATGKAAYTMADIKKNSPEELADYLADPKNKARLMLNPRVNQISSQLTMIRDKIKQIGLIPDDKMSSEERGRRIDQLRNQEEQILKSVNLKQMREQAEL